ncbi:hypothetical protein [Roseovarius aestuarii]|uniref:hypothetical protein n=1 Tax=Roseovarius aestuarii TaxID=475083 RepID=UPI001CBD94DB|nr:hypothetical protein [Roseovarius aestuarii]
MRNQANAAKFRLRVSALRGVPHECQSESSIPNRFQERNGQQNKSLAILGKNSRVGCGGFLPKAKGTGLELAESSRLLSRCEEKELAGGPEQKL